MDVISRRIGNYRCTIDPLFKTIASRGTFFKKNQVDLNTRVCITLLEAFVLITV